MQSKQLIGAHQSTVGGYSKAVEKINQIGGNCLMIFASSPRDWKEANPDESEVIKFVKLKKELKIDPVYFHATYLINLVDGGEIGEKSKKLLISELRLASKMGVKGSIVHVGSFKKDEPNYEVLEKNIREVLKNTPENTFLIVENAGNRKVGKTLEEIGIIARWDKRIKVCLDTCHLHAAGYDLTDLGLFLETFNAVVGLEKLELFHANDSKDEFGSLRDRHENIGVGKVGLEIFQKLLNNPLLKTTPFICEVPGFENLGPDKRNLDILKGLII